MPTKVGPCPARVVPHARLNCVILIRPANGPRQRNRTACVPYVSHVVLFLADAGNEAHGVRKSPQNLGFAAKSARSVACVTFRRKCDKMR